MLLDDEGLDLVMYLGFIVPLVENDYDSVMCMVNSTDSIATNSLIVGDVNSLLRYTSDGSCCFILYFGNKVIILLLSILFSIMMIYFVMRKFLSMLLLLRQTIYFN